MQTKPKKVRVILQALLKSVWEIVLNYLYVFYPIFDFTLMVESYLELFWPTQRLKFLVKTIRWMMKKILELCDVEGYGSHKQDIQ